MDRSVDHQRRAERSRSRLKPARRAGAITALLALASCVVPIPIPIVVRTGTPASSPPPRPSGMAGGAPTPAATQAPSAPSKLSEAEKQAILAEQNLYRAQVGQAPLAWSETLAGHAQAWADQLAQKIHALQHSHTEGEGENLTMSTAGRYPLAELVKMWGDEKQHFIRAAFPAVSADGNWKTVGHYTQLVWHSTTEVGCGLATGGGFDFLVCHYAPPGNFMGEKVY